MYLTQEVRPVGEVANGCNKQNEDSVMEKIVRLMEHIKDDNDNVVATMYTTLKGDGETPNVMTIGGNPLGFNDDGSPILSEGNDEIIAQAQQNFMAEAIKEQKSLCVENGVDPDLVNILNAEKKVNNNE